MIQTYGLGPGIKISLARLALIGSGKAREIWEAALRISARAVLNQSIAI
jgi:hypothetical protein